MMRRFADNNLRFLTITKSEEPIEKKTKHERTEKQVNKQGRR